MYADDVYAQMETIDCGQRLHVNFEDEEPLTLVEGERRLFNLWISNTGVQDIEELWLVAGPDDELWIDLHEELSPSMFLFSCRSRAYTIVDSFY
jgi:trafficking protein particle complex subunit 8